MKKKEFKCQYCGKVLKSLNGVRHHEKICKENPANKHLEEVEEEVEEEEIKEDVVEEEIKEEVEEYPKTEDNTLTAEANKEAEIEDTEFVAPSVVIAEDEMMTSKEQKEDVRPDYYNQLERLVNRFKMSGSVKKEDIPLITKLYKKFTGKPAGNTNCSRVVVHMALVVATNFNKGKV